MNRRFSKITNMPSALLTHIGQLARQLPDPNKHDPGLPLPELMLPRDIRIFTRTSSDFTRAKPHANVKCHVLIVNISGTAVVVLDELPITFHPGAALTVFPDQYHHYVKPRGRFFWIFIGFRLPQYEFLLPVKNVPIMLAPHLWAHLAGCLEGYVNSRCAGPDVGGQIAVELWQLLLGLHARHALLPPVRANRRSLPKEQYRMLLKAQQFILDRKTTPPHVGDVARHLNMSPTKLQMLFKKHLGQGVARCIRRQRINYAGHLINLSECSMKQIAHQCGFSSIYVFSRAFKHETGYAPRAYRRLLNTLHRPTRRASNPPPAQLP